MAPEKDYTHRSWIAVTLLIAVLIGLSLIPPQTLGGMAQFVANGWAGKDYTHINFAGGRRVAWALYDAINRGAEQHPPFTPVAHDNVIDTRKISHLEMMLRQAARPRMQKP